MKIRLLVLCMLLTTVLVKAQFVKYSNEFLASGVGARAAGMGNAVVSSVDDATGGYWNPASLLNIQETYQVALMHNEQFAGIVKHDYGTIAYRPDEKNAYAFTVIRMGIDDIPNTLNLIQNGQIDYSRLRSFSAVDYAFIGSFARDIGIRNLQLGGNVKLIRRVIGDFANAWGFGFDLGARYEWKKFRLGVMIRDVTTTFNAWSFSFSEAEKTILLSSGNTLPANSIELTAPKTTIGISRTWMFFHEKLSVQPEMNADLTLDGKRNVLLNSKWINLDPRIGLEVGYGKMVYLRSGLMNIQKIKSIDGKTSLNMMASIGAGIRFNRFSIDYALANPGNAATLPHSNIISLKIGINKG